MMRLPMAACNGDLEHVAVDLRPCSFLTTARPRRSASRRSQMIERASTRLPFTRMSSRTRSAGAIAEEFVVHRAVAARGALELVVHVVDHFGQRQVVDEHRPRRREVFGRT